MSSQNVRYLPTRRTSQTSLKTDVKNVLFFVFLTFACVDANVCESDKCTSSICLFEDSQIRFGRTDGSIISSDNFKVRVSHKNAVCVDAGNWYKPGNSSLGKPYRSPCTKLKEKGFEIPDVWISQFSLTTGKKVAYRWDFKKWDIAIYDRPSKVIVNDYLNCHPNDSSMIIVEDENGNPIFNIGIPLHFTIGGGDASVGDAIIASILVLCFFLLFICFVITGCNSSGSESYDFATGYVIGSWVNGDWDYDEEFGGFGSD